MTAADQLRAAKALIDALAKIMPIRVHNGPDYAEVYFADGSKHSTQAMTMNPQDWLDVQAAYDTAIALASPTPSTGGDAPRHPAGIPQW